MTEEQYSIARLIPLGGVLRNRIPIFLLLRGETLAILSQRARVSTRTLRSLVTGATTTITLQNALRISKALGVDVEDVFDLDHPASEVYEATIPPEETDEER